MKIKNIKQNFILNGIRLTFGMIFILLTTPYITRILGVENFGKVEYANSIIAYFLLFTALGIPNYGIREVAKCRNDKEELSKIVLELGIILFITTLLGYLILIILIFNSKLILIKNLIYILSVNIFFTNIGFEWFYQGIENQSYITIRFIVVRIFALILMFIFIKQSSDYLKYGIILVIMYSGSNFLNFIHLKKYITIKNINFKSLNILRHIRPILVIFSASLATSIYLQLDTVMLGRINQDAVGLYAVSNRIVRLVLTIVTVLGSVLLPRITNMYQNNDIINYKRYLNLSLNYIYLVALPSVVGILLLAKDIVLLIAGQAYLESIVTMKILAIIIFIVGMAYFLGYNFLYPRGLEKYYTCSVIISAIINFIFNYIMIPKYYQNGAAFGTVIAETTGVLLMLYFTRKYWTEINLFSLARLKYLIAAGIMGLYLIIIKSLVKNYIVIILLSISLGSIIYFFSLYLLKEQITREAIRLLKMKLERKK